MLRKPFKSPHPNAPSCSQVTKRLPPVHGKLMCQTCGLHEPSLLSARRRFKGSYCVGGGLCPGAALLFRLSARPCAQCQSSPPNPRRRRAFPRSGHDAPAVTCRSSWLLLQSCLLMDRQHLQVELPPDIEPLVLWEPPEGDPSPPVEVDSMLTRWLRPHQREGVQFMFECVAGLRTYPGHGGSAQHACLCDQAKAAQAHDLAAPPWSVTGQDCEIGLISSVCSWQASSWQMTWGLGKTLQGIALLWTMLQCGHPSLGGTPMAKRVIICCPTSLVSNWDSECEKWLQASPYLTCLPDLQHTLARPTNALTLIATYRAG